MFKIFKITKKRVTKKRSKKSSEHKKYYKDAKLLVIKIIEDLKKENHKINLLTFNKIFIKNQKTRWGSCSSAKNLNFNYKILFLPYDLAEYLVVHELCHLEHMNHSKDYWNLVEYVLPNYKMSHKRLKNINLNQLNQNTVYTDDLV